MSTALLTGLALFAACISAVALWAAVRTFEKAEGMVASLERDLRALAVLRIDVDSLDTRVRRLAGTIYSPPRKSPARAMQDAAQGVVENGDVGDVDGELAAMLALQTATPPRPQ